MCEPTTLLAISVGLGAIGTGIAVHGSIQAGKARKAEMERQAVVARKNAEIAKENADETKKQGQRDIARKRLETRQLIARQRVGMGANGIELDSGSALDVQLDSQMMGELDAENIKRNAELKARAYLQQGENFNYQADANIASGNAAQRAGVLNGVASGLSGAGSVISGYYSATNTPSTTTPIP